MDVLLPPAAQCPVRAAPAGLSPAHAAVRAAKAELRAAILRERGRRSEASRRAVAAGLRDVVLELAAVRAAEQVAVYLSRPGEPGTRPLRAALVGRGVDVVLPVIGRATGLRWLHAGEPGRHEPHRRLTEPPSAGAELSTGVHVLVVPALAVDTAGRRLGRGCDGYDRILRRLDPGVLVLATVHDEEVLDSAVESVPEEPHDVRVGAVLTPTRVFAVGAGTGARSAA